MDFEQNNKPKKPVLKQPALYAMLAGVLIVVISLIYIFWPASDTAKTASFDATQPTPAQLDSTPQPITVPLNNSGSLTFTAGSSALDFKWDSAADARAVLLYFVAPDCPPCSVQSAHINAALAANAGIELLAIFPQDLSPTDTDAALKAHQISSPHLTGPAAKTLAKALSITHLPSMALYLKSGEQAFLYSGLVPLEMLQFDLKKAL